MAWTPIRNEVRGRPLDTLGDPWAARVRASLAAGRFEGVHRFFRHCAPRYRSFYAWSVSAWSGRPGFLDDWVAREPDTALPWLLRGAHGIRWAWQARDGGWARRGQGWNAYVDRLHRAQDDLYKAAELDARSHVPWALLVILGTESWGVLSRVADVYREAESRLPGDWLANASMLQACCAKWLGSHDVMFDFARRASLGGVPELGLEALVAVAHTERWLLATWEEERAGRADAWWARPVVRDELARAFDRSIFARDPSWGEAPSRYRIPQANAFAFALGRAGDRDRAALALHATRSQPTERPWGYEGRPARIYARARRAAGL